MEKLNYGGGRDYDDYDGDEVEFDGHDGPGGHLDYADTDGYWGSLELLDLIEQLEYQAEFAADDSGETDFERRFGPKSKASRRRRGPFRPPDRRHHRRPVFVKVKDLQDRFQEVEQQGYVPLHHDDPDDEKLADLLAKLWADEHRTPPESGRPSECGEKVISRSDEEKQGL